jgi:hypothetical protein
MNAPQLDKPCKWVEFVVKRSNEVGWPAINVKDTETLHRGWLDEVRAASSRDGRKSEEKKEAERVAKKEAAASRRRLPRLRRLRLRRSLRRPRRRPLWPSRSR